MLRSHLIIIVFYYFLLRYWQYFNEEIFLKKELLQLWDSLDRVKISYLRKATWRKIELSLGKPAERIVYGIGNIGELEPSSIFDKNIAVRIGIFSKKIVVPFSVVSTQDHNDNKLNNLIKNTLRSLDETPHFFKTNEPPHQSVMVASTNKKNNYRVEILYSEAYIFLNKIKFFIRFIINRSLFTDYYLAFVMAFTANIFIVRWFFS